MSGAIPPLPNTCSGRGSYLSTEITSPYLTVTDETSYRLQFPQNSLPFVSPFFIHLTLRPEHSCRCSLPSPVNCSAMFTVYMSASLSSKRGFAFLFNILQSLLTNWGSLFKLLILVSSVVLCSHFLLALLLSPSETTKWGRAQNRFNLLPKKPQGTLASGSR
jgi:hypothetical protein